MPTKDIIIPICCGPQLNLASDQRAKIPFRPEKTKLTKKYNMKRYERFLYFNRDNIVLVVTASAHRKEAFKSAEFIMDFLKSRAPIWKKEHYKTHSSWVQSIEKDELIIHDW